MKELASLFCEVAEGITRLQRVLCGFRRPMTKTTLRTIHNVAARIWINPPANLALLAKKAFATESSICNGVLFTSESKSMRINILSAGYVGLVTGLSLAKSGNHHVTICDTDEDRVRSLLSGKMPFFEAGLEALFQECVTSGRVNFRTDLEGCLADGSNVTFVAVGTPKLPNGNADAGAVFSTCEKIAKSAVQKGPSHRH